MLHKCSIIISFRAYFRHAVIVLLFYCEVYVIFTKEFKNSANCFGNRWTNYGMRFTFFCVMHSLLLSFLIHLLHCLDYSTKIVMKKNYILISKQQFSNLVLKFISVLHNILMYYLIKLFTELFSKTTEVKKKVTWNTF